MQHRELLWMFFERDLKIRYRQVFIGVLWVLLQPTLGMGIFLAIFWLVDAKPVSDTQQYASSAAIVYIGMLLWQFVASSLRDGTGSLVNYRHVITKIAFPRLLLPLSSVCCAAFDALIASLILPVLLWIMNDSIAWATCWITIIACVGLAVFVVGCVAWLSSLNAFYRDVGFVLPFALQVMMFVSPVVYDAARVQNEHGIAWLIKIAYEANPICNSIGWVRMAILGGPAPNIVSTLIAIMLTVCIFLTGLWWFRLQNARLADRI
jgi:lipopolysaccharide transport system permease protein